MLWQRYQLPLELDKHVDDLYGNPFHATLAEVVEHLSMPPTGMWTRKPRRGWCIQTTNSFARVACNFHDAHRATVYGTTRCLRPRWLPLHLPCQPERQHPLVCPRGYRKAGTDPGGAHAAEPLVAPRPRHD